MPDFPEVQRQKWITLPQALRWFVDDEEPSPENVGGLPLFLDGDKSREVLFNYWAEGELKLYGFNTANSNAPYLAPYRPYEEDCDESAGMRSIPPDVITKAGLYSINWAQSTLGSFFLEDGLDSAPYWVNLRVRWDEIYKIKKGSLLPVAAISLPPPQRKRRSDLRDDWPVIIALTAIIRTCEWGSSQVKTRNALYRRVTRILAAIYKTSRGVPSQPNWKDEALGYVETAASWYEADKNKPR